MTFDEWYEANVKYMNTADFKPWMSEAWDAAVLKATLEEREACAKVCDEALKHDWGIPHKPALVNCAAAIRARGEK